MASITSLGLAGLSLLLGSACDAENEAGTESAETEPEYTENDCVMGLVDFTSEQQRCAMASGQDKDGCLSALGPKGADNPCGLQCTFIEWVETTQADDACSFGETRRECVLDAPSSEGCAHPRGCDGQSLEPVVLLNEDGEVGHAYNVCGVYTVCNFSQPLAQDQVVCECGCGADFPVGDGG